MSYPDATPKRKQSNGSKTGCPECGGNVKRAWIRYPTHQLEQWEICQDCDARIRMLPHKRKADRPASSP